MQNELINQFNQCWVMLQQAIDKVPDELLYRDENDWRYCKVTYHTIETAEFYVRDTPAGMEWGKWSNVNWKTDTLETIKDKLTKEDLFDYLKDVAVKVESKLQDFDQEKLREKDGFGDWFPSITSKFLYLLRHTMLHIGELSRALREVEEEMIVWM
ncbi:MAG: hypothetical protein ACXAB7_05375 [Candidatus Kariarchaeaceae archaeon]|jgi:hypothetical protein